MGEAERVTNEVLGKVWSRKTCRINCGGRTCIGVWYTTFRK